MRGQTKRQGAVLATTVLVVIGLFLLLGAGVAAAGHDDGAHAGSSGNCDDADGNGGGWSAGYSDGNIEPVNAEDVTSSADGVETLVTYSSEQQYPACGEGQQDRDHTGGDYDHAEVYVHSGEGVGFNACYSEDNQEQPDSWASVSEDEDACGNDFERPEDRE